MARLLNVAKKQRLHLIEDVAQAFGARAALSNGSSKCAGTIGDLGCFSFFPTKTLGGMGDGGLVATNRRESAEKIRLLRHHGESSQYRHEAIGLNSRLDEVQAAVLSVKLRYLDQWIEGRIERAHLYQKLFEETGLIGREIIGLPLSRGGRNHIFNYYVIRVARRDALRERLSQQGIQSAIYYPVPLHLQSCFASLGYHTGDFPASELVATQAVALPIYPELLPEQQQYVVEAIRKFYRR